jgi:RimJ/RimL family protein N-acetyltransferase
MERRLGNALDDWRPPPAPPRVALEGRCCTVAPLEPATHARDLHAANLQDATGEMWSYLSYGPFASLEDYRRWAEEQARSTDPLFFAVVDARSGRASGIASYLRVDRPNGVVEVGHLAWSPALQRTTAATEAMYLMMRQAFELGYRRYEWKCNALNQASMAAARRLGFTYEGTFRQHMVRRGRNRDTAWFSILDGEWPRVRAALERWLDPANFDRDGRQVLSLAACRAALPSCIPDPEETA